MISIPCVVASGPVIIEDGKVLLCRHGKSPEDQKIWKFVGGRVDESYFRTPGNFNVLEEACHQKVMDEMGLKIEITGPIKPMMITHPNTSDVYVVLIHWLAKRLNEIKAGRQILEYAWHDIDNLPLDSAPNIRPVIEAYKNSL